MKTNEMATESLTQAQIRPTEAQNQIGDHRKVAVLAPEVQDALRINPLDAINKVNKSEEKGIIDLVKPVVQLARAESVKKYAQGNLTDADKALIDKYDALVNKAISQNWMGIDEINAKANEQNVIKNEAEAKIAAQNLVSAAEAAVATIDFSSPESIAKNQGKLSAIRSHLEFLASKLNTHTSWDQLAAMAGASISTIAALSGSLV